MPLQKTLFVYVITKQKVIFPKKPYIKVSYITLNPMNKRLKSLQKIKKFNSLTSWVITDMLSVITIAKETKYKTIFLANGKEIGWQITLYSYPDVIVSSIDHAYNFLQLIRCTG